MVFAFLGSPADLLIVMAVALVVFGPKRLPEVGRQLGGFVRELRKTMSHITDAVEDVGHDFRSVAYDEDVHPRGAHTIQADLLMKPYDQRDPVPAPPRLPEPEGAPDDHGDPARKLPLAAASAPHDETSDGGHHESAGEPRREQPLAD